MTTSTAALLPPPGRRFGARAPGAILAALMLAVLALRPAAAQGPAYELSVRPAMPSAGAEVALVARSACKMGWEAPRVDGKSISLVAFDAGFEAPCSPDLPYETTLEIPPLGPGSHLASLWERTAQGDLSLATSLRFDVSDTAPFSVALDPPLPTPLEPADLRVRSACPWSWDPPAIEGSTIRLVASASLLSPGAPCSTDLPYLQSFGLGPLPPGKKIVEIWSRRAGSEPVLEHAEVFAVVAGVQYRVFPGSNVEGCGGFVGGCLPFRFEGEITLSADYDLGIARITDSSLRVGAATGPLVPFPAEGDLQPWELEGRIVRGELRFTDPADARQIVDWRFTPTREGLELDGSWNEGCCDRYVYTFVAVPLQRASVSGIPSLDRAGVLVFVLVLGLYAAWRLQG